MEFLEEELKLLDFAHLNALSGKWILVILLVISLYRGTNFYALRKRIEGISSKVLSQKLRLLEEAGLVIKKIVVEHPKRVEFYLTREGSELAEAFFRLLRLNRA